MLTLTSPVETALHRMPAGWKLVGLALATLVVVPMTDLRWIAVAAALVVGLYLMQGVAFAKAGARMLWPLWPFLVVLAVWHAVTGDLVAGFGIALRMLTAIAIANLVTMTTRLDDLIAVVERCARPLVRIGLNPRTLAVAIALVIRFTPVLLLRAGQLMEAWRARSPRRPGWQVVAPLALSALDDAERVAEALRARGGL
ncbi:energy-coupling factor transporter transmembrane protein EcfT [Tabrizicola sp. J26]|uniref:energy-coupling factor transporter transmembrane component T family protein n=1 Tax=Alitabrizicola rongguiensis TaxID=2909234 RepID=UPI001F38CFAB|nr:energy-coupling factor transporter transmembrane protein EcfT [Tabrizicola rongguiensis]MCF1707270.1 energy-coupling factor transporter transmembrane protein EcfT [Tabrizicola rongguiensis]